jgi:hypothetical protein
MPEKIIFLKIEESKNYQKVKTNVFYIKKSESLDITTIFFVSSILSKYSPCDVINIHAAMQQIVQIALKYKSLLPCDQQTGSNFN